MKTCKLCFSNDIGVIRKIPSPHVPHDYKLYKCNNCKSRFCDHLEYPVSLDEIYERMSPMRNTEVEFHESEYWTDRKNMLVKHLGKEPASLLDVGCETGTFLMHFPSVPVKEGVELSKNSVEIAIKRGLTVHQDFLENIRFTHTFEVVTAFAILEHLIEPHQFLNKLDNLVENNGILSILIPTHQCFKEKLMNFLGKRWKMYSPPEHLNFYSRSFLDNYLSQKGYILVERYYDSGGSFNPMEGVPMIGKLTKALIKIADKRLLRRFAFFDHMYSIYRKK